MNTRHAQALAATAEAADQIRHQISTTLRKLVELEPKLHALTTTRQSVGRGLVTDESRARANERAILDRAAARGYHAPRGVGLAFLNAPGRLGTGQIAAPATIAAVDALAQIHFGILHQLRRLRRPAYLVALELEQTLEEDRGVCPWPRDPLVVRPLNVDAPLAELAAQLENAIGNYTSRPGLQAISEDLDRLEETALTALAGPASTNHPDPCPWCGRESLVIYHRDGERPIQVIRCEGRHECLCDFEFCGCHRNPFANRHEWINSGGATHTWHQLHNLQTTRKEALMLETKAIDALEEIRHLHAPRQLELDPGVVDYCPACRGEDGTLAPWPCPTYRLTDLDGELDDQGEVDES